MQSDIYKLRWNRIDEIGNEIKKLQEESSKIYSVLNNDRYIIISSLLPDMQWSFHSIVDTNDGFLEFRIKDRKKIDDFIQLTKIPHGNDIHIKNQIYIRCQYGELLLLVPYSELKNLSSMTNYSVDVLELKKYLKLLQNKIDRYNAVINIVEEFAGINDKGGS
jgi:hypothetical protein